MSKVIRDYKATPRLVALAANGAVTVAARRGTEIRSLQGELWVTHEGDHQDYVVPAGARFCSGQRGRVVVSALGEPGRALIASCEPKRAGGFVRSSIEMDYRRIDAIRARAERMRAAAIARLLNRGWQAMVRGWQRIAGGVIGRGRAAAGLR